MPEKSCMTVSENKDQGYHTSMHEHHTLIWSSKAVAMLVCISILLLSSISSGNVLMYARGVCTRIHEATNFILWRAHLMAEVSLAVLSDRLSETMWASSSDTPWWSIQNSNRAKVTAHHSSPERCIMSHHGTPKTCHLLFFRSIVIHFSLYSIRYCWERATTMTGPEFVSHV